MKADKLKAIEKDFLEFIEDDFRLNPYEWMDYLVETAMANLDGMSLSEMFEWYSDDPEHIAEMLELDVSEVKAIMNGEV